MRCPLVASQAVCLESIPRVATCAMTPRRAPTSSTMATRIAATRVPLAARRSGELRPCKLAPASGAKRSTRSPAHCPCASCRQMRTGRRRQSLLSDARHRSPICTPQLVAPIDARVGGLQPRDERSRHLDSPPDYPLPVLCRRMFRAFLANATRRRWFRRRRSRRDPLYYMPLVAAAELTFEKVDSFWSFV